MMPSPRPGWLLGVDVSRVQGKIDPNALAAAGVGFVIAKATDGLRSVDSEWLATAEAVARTQLLLGAYHVLEPNADPLTQADHFLSLYQQGAEMTLTTVRVVGSMPPAVPSLRSRPWMRPYAR
jgi:lysozyme